MLTFISTICLVVAALLGMIACIKVLRAIKELEKANDEVRRTVTEIMPHISFDGDRDRSEVHVKRLWRDMDDQEPTD